MEQREAAAPQVATGKAPRFIKGEGIHEANASYPFPWSMTHLI